MVKKKGNLEDSVVEIMKDNLNISVPYHQLDNALAAKIHITDISLKSAAAAILDLTIR